MNNMSQKEGEVVKVVLIGDRTVANIKQLLENCLEWLNRDAQYAHPKSKVHQFKADVELVRQQIIEDETKFLGKKFNIETPGDIPTDKPE